ncbi:MAG: YggS family pyridoxal phosphate-dependent enzyme [Pirellulales bacterium]|nr:YggS family pyridoxal phosphate-dependent enzyme [Pirellulales bacterium]
MTDAARRIAENVARVRGRIAEAAARAGRRPEAVQLIAVTKYVGLDEMRAVVAAGCAALGENRPQELERKAASLHDLPIQWHLIGHLQRNKVRRVLPLVAMIQSVDSPRVLEAVDRIAGELGRRAPVLLEVNVSGESQKTGLDPQDVEPLVETLERFPHVEPRGLMAMSSIEGGSDRVRADFAAVRELRDRIQKNCPDGVNLAELSMGMSGDFEVAVEEGATIVRIGSALFE